MLPHIDKLMDISNYSDVSIDSLLKDQSEAYQKEKDEVRQNDRMETSNIPPS